MRDPYTVRHATFQPKNRTTLRPELIPAIGREMQVHYAWTEDAGIYAGQRVYLEACEPGVPADALVSRGKWMPEEDLVFAEE